MYADYTYYTAVFGGRRIQTEEEFNRAALQASRRLDSASGGKLAFAFPEEEAALQAVKDCVCELAEFLYETEGYRKELFDGTGYRLREDGAVTGKAVVSLASGSESIHFAAADGPVPAALEAARDRKVRDVTIFCIIREGVGGIRDRNGVNLLYAGPYPEGGGPWA